MLKADIAWSDLSHDPVWRQDAVVVGNSRIVPYQHAALETLLVCTEGRWFAVIRERRTGASFDEVSNVETVTAQRFDELYRSCLLWPLDYMMIEVAKQGRRIKLRAGVLGSAPVYCRATDERVSVSWDFADFLAEKLPVDFEAASCSLALDQVYSARQICMGVHLLTERATFYLEPGRAQYRYPTAFEVPAPVASQDDVDVVAAFGQSLQRAISMRPMTADRIAVELSGGMDSATVACALTALHGPVASQGILVSGDVRMPQIERRKQIVARLGLHDEVVDIDAFPPSLDLRPQARKEYVNTEYYLEAFEALWGSAHGRGRDLMFTGLGGDELFLGALESGQDGHTVDDPEVSSSRRYARQLLTPRALSAARSLHAFDAPAGPVPSVMASVSKAHHLLRHGAWPVNPLSDPNLMVFCYQLPAAHRRRRDTMRRYLRACLGEEVFPHDYAKETFAQVLPGLIAKQKTAIAAQLRECALADLGLVDQRAVLALLDEVSVSQASAPTSALVNALWMERFVRQLL
jgi:asparagine synthase (glutamine-hydrolysing)